MSLIADYSYCENIIKANSKSFYAAFSILPKAKRNSVYAIYAFCRYADDSIDVLHSLDKLLELESLLNQFKENNTPDTPIFRALEDTFQTFDIDIEPFYHMIEGQKLDFNFTQPTSIEALQKYSYHVAGTVGLMLLPIIATKNKDQLRDAALALGEAMQFTNILRDIGEDYRENRIYIPSDLLSKYPRALDAIKTNKVNDDFIRVWEILASIAEENYNKFFEKLHLFDDDSKKAVVNSAIFYGEILNVVRKNNYNCLSQRQYVSSFDFLNVKIKNLLEKNR